MTAEQLERSRLPRDVVLALGEVRPHRLGDIVTVILCFSLGDHRLPPCLHGKAGTVEPLVTPAIDNEDGDFGSNAGTAKHCCRIAFPIAEILSDYNCPWHDNLRVEMFETWLEPPIHA